jgi:hypothetical protein
MSQGAGAGLLDSNKAAGGDTQAVLAAAVQQAISKIQTAPVSTTGLVKGELASQVVGQATAEPPERQQAPQIGSLAANIPALQEGGVAPPGQPFIAGEAGGAPEMVTPTPDGSNVVTPITTEQAQAMMGGQGGAARPAAQPTGQATPAARGPTAAQTTAAPAQATAPEVADFDLIGMLSKMGDLGVDIAIASALGNPALVINLQQNRAEQRKFMAAQALENPSILATSPEAAQAIESIFGEGSAEAILRGSQPGEQYRRQAIGLGLNIVPPGTLDASGKPAPGLIEQINKQVFERQLGFRIGPDGLQLSRSAPSHEEISSALSYSVWATITQAYQDAGMNQIEADTTAARQLLGELSGVGIVVPPELRELAMANTTADVDAKRQAVIRAATKNVDLAFAGPLAGATAAARAVGEVRGTAAAGAMEMKLTRDDGTVVTIPLPQAAEFFERTSTLAAAIAGVPGAVDMGTAPNKALLSSMAMKGMDIIEDAAGHQIGLPIGHSFGGATVTAGELVAGPEAMKMLDEVLLLLDDVAAVPNLLDAFPSEKEWGLKKARTLGFLKSYVRSFTDSTELLYARGQLRQLGFRMARLLGSNSQLSDAERAAAESIYSTLREGTGTREQVQFMLRRSRELAMRGKETTARPGQAGRPTRPDTQTPRAGQPGPTPTTAPPEVPQPAGSVLLTLPDGSTIVAEQVQ